MPIYEYKCLKCGKEFEVIQKFSDEPLRKCSDCEGEVRKLISNTSFILKGTGWYATDYASSERKKAVDAEKDTNGKKAVETAAKNGEGAKTASSVSTETK
jgi:putative FmdB family regulatory protein